MTANDSGAASRTIPVPTSALAVRYRSDRLSINAVWLITTYLLALMLIPANLTFAPLGAAGSPASILGVACLLWWGAAQLNRAFATLTRSQPVRRAMLLFTITVMASYIAATTRAIEGLELSGADRGLILLASWLGVVLLTVDGVHGIDRIMFLVRTLVTCGGIVATIGLVQFTLGIPVTDIIQIPGLTANTDLVSIFNREGFARAAGTSTHPIEFGVVLSMILPVALHLAFQDTHRSAIARWYPVAVIAIAIPITISRSAIVATAVALLVVLPTWTRFRRRVAYVSIVGIGTLVFLAIPGMLGTITGLFTGISNDGSAASRTNSYGLALEYISRMPVFGRGFGTFLPQYRILDNQYLSLMIEVGIVGLAATLFLFVVGVVTAFAIRRRSDSPAIRGLAQSLAALLLAGACSFATFDAFGFPQTAGLVFLGLGLVGALSNTQRDLTDGSLYMR